MPTVAIEKSLSIEGPLGALSWRNWVQHEQGTQPMYEATLYSDARFTGGLVVDGMGPYTLINMVRAREGELGDALVLRWSWHLPEPTYRPDDPEKLQTNSWLGLEPDEEFAALLALVLGVRLSSGGVTREFRNKDDPRGLPIAFRHTRPLWERPKRSVLPRFEDSAAFLGTVPDLIGGFPTLSAKESVALIRAARLYQSAVWVADQDPEFAWLQLVSAVEVAAAHWRGQLLDPLRVLKESMPDLAALLEARGGEDLVNDVASELADLTKSRRRFLDFLLTFMPDPPKDRCEEHFQVPWSELERRLNLVYNYRSKRLHVGEPFPPAMNEVPTVLPETGRPCERPFGVASFTFTAQWPASKLPMYLWVFEHIVHGALLRWSANSLGIQARAVPE